MKVAQEEEMREKRTTIRETKQVTTNPEHLSEPASYSLSCRQAIFRAFHHLYFRIISACLLLGGSNVTVCMTQ